MPDSARLSMGRAGVRLSMPGVDAPAPVMGMRVESGRSWGRFERLATLLVHATRMVGFRDSEDLRAFGSDAALRLPPWFLPR